MFRSMDCFHVPPYLRLWAAPAAVRLRCCHHSLQVFYFYFYKNTIVLQIDTITVCVFISSAERSNRSFHRQIPVTMTKARLRAKTASNHRPLSPQRDKGPLSGPACHVQYLRDTRDRAAQLSQDTETPPVPTWSGEASEM